MGHGGSIDAAPIRVGSAFPRRSDRPSLAFRCRFQITDVRASGNPLQEVRPHGSIGPSKRICQDDRNGCDSQYCYCQRNELGTGSSPETPDLVADPVSRIPFPKRTSYADNRPEAIIAVSCPSPSRHSLDPTAV